MANPDLVKSFTADTVIAPYRIVKHGTTGDTYAAQATAVTEGLLGVSGILGAAIGSRIDIYLDDTAEVECGGTITRGDWLTTDANGKAITAAPAVGVNNNVIGRAMMSGVLGDIFVVLLAPGRIQG
jgi:hypothetical protein